jgi:hypothetical protein
MGCSDKQPMKKKVKPVDYREEIYEQLLIMNGKIERFLQFIKYAAIGGFVTTAVYLLLKVGKVF